MSRFLQSNDYQRKLILSSGKESYYEHFTKRSYSSPNMTPGTESMTASTRMKMPNMGSEGFACSSYLSTVNRNSRLIHFSSCIKTPVKPEQTVPKTAIQKVATEMAKMPSVLRFVFFRYHLNVNIYVTYDYNRLV